MANLELEQGVVVYRRTSLTGHSKQNKGHSDVWFTPRYIIDALGPFDLDPCTLPPDERPWDTARFHYSEVDDGLEQSWELLSCPDCGPSPRRGPFGCPSCSKPVPLMTSYVWLNSPFGPAVKHWLKKLADHKNGIALVHARTETDWFHRQIWERATGILFLEGRITFHRPDGTKAKNNSGCPVCLVAYGEYALGKLTASNLPGRLVRLQG